MLNTTASLNVSNNITDIPEFQEYTSPSVSSILKSTVYVIAIVLGITINFLCICVLIKTKEDALSKNAKLFLTCLNISDLFQCILGIFPASYNFALNLPVWVFSKTFCTVHATLTNFGLATSYYFVVAIAVDRYIAVVYALRYQDIFTLKRACLVVVGIVILSTLLQVNGENYEYLKAYGSCWFALLDKRTAISHIIAVTLVSLVPFFIIIGLYVRIILIARSHSQRIRAQVGGVSQNFGGDENNIRKADFKATITFFLITGVFGLAFMPYYASLIYVVNTLRWPNSTWMFIVRFMGVCGTWLNAFIYYVRNKWFQKELKQLLSSCRR